MMESVILRQAILRKKTALALHKHAEEPEKTPREETKQESKRVECSPKSSFLEGISLLWKGTQGFTVGRKTEEHLRINIADTILFEGGLPTTWFFCSKKTGKVLKKNTANVNLRSIVKALGQRSEELYWSCHASTGREEDESSVRKRSTTKSLKRGGQFVCVARYQMNQRDNLRVEFLKAHQLLELFDDKIRMNQLVALQANVHVPQVSSIYSTTYRLGRNGITSEFQTSRLVDDKSILGQDARRKAYEEQLQKLLPDRSRERTMHVKENQVQLHSRVHELNKECERTLLQIVRFVEATRPGCLLDGLRAEFILVPGVGPILTHLSDIRFRKPIVRKLESLSVRSEDSESLGSVLSSRSSLSQPSLLGSPEKVEDKAYESKQRQDSPSKIAERVKMIAMGPPRVGHSKAGCSSTNQDLFSAKCLTQTQCWGQYCQIRDLFPIVPMQAKNAVSIPRAGEFEAVQWSSSDGATDTNKVLLLAIVQAYLQNIQLLPCKSQLGSSFPDFEIIRVGSPERMGARQIEDKFGVSTIRLYEVVDVCSTCFHVYKFLEKARNKFEEPSIDENKNVTSELKQAIDLTKRLENKLAIKPKLTRTTPNSDKTTASVLVRVPEQHLLEKKSLPKLHKPSKTKQQQSVQLQQEELPEDVQIQVSAKRTEETLAPAPPKHPPLLNPTPSKPLPLKQVVQNRSEIWRIEFRMAHHDTESDNSDVDQYETRPTIKVTTTGPQLKRGPVLPPPGKPPTSLERDSLIDSGAQRDLASLRSKLSSHVLDTSGSKDVVTTQGKIVHPPLFALRSHLYIPPQTM